MEMANAFTKDDQPLICPFSCLEHVINFLGICNKIVFRTYYVLGFVLFFMDPLT